MANYLDILDLEKNHHKKTSTIDSVQNKKDFVRAALVVLVDNEPQAHGVGLRWGTGRDSYFQPVYGQPGYLSFGVAALDEFVKYGYLEYHSVAWVWRQNGVEMPNRRGPTGKFALWQFVLHEFAHVLQDRVNGASHGDIHNDCFRIILSALIKKYPYKLFREM